MRTKPTYGYCIVRIGELPENLDKSALIANLTIACVEWTELSDKAQFEVIRIHLGTNEIIKRYSATEAERIAIVYSRPDFPKV